jgi:hypothetical protein
MSRSWLKAFAFASTCAALLATAGPAAAAVDGPRVDWNLSVWGPPRAFTAGIETIAKYVNEQTGGKFTIKIHYGDTLSKGPDNLDNIKLGAFEMAQICTGYHPGKHLGINVLDLPGLPLADPDVHAMVHDVVYRHPYIEAEFKRWNAKVLLSVLQPQSELMGVGEPPLTMASFKGHARAGARRHRGCAAQSRRRADIGPGAGGLQRARARRFPGGGAALHLCVRLVQDS